MLREADLEDHRKTPPYRTCVDMIAPITIGSRGKMYFNPIDVEEVTRD